MKLSTQKTKSFSITHACSKVFLVYTFIFLQLLVPAVTHAGLFSFISEISSSITGKQASAETESVISESSQNIQLLEAANTPDPSLKPLTEIAIIENQALLPEVGPSTLALDKVDNSNGQIALYTVRQGDTLSDIAKMYDVTVNTILWANDLTKASAIRPGQTLIILPMSGVLHTVVAKDTLETIAKKYGGEVSEIALFNDLKPGAKLAIGDTIIVPDGEMSFSTRPSTNNTSTQTARLVSASGGPDLGGYYKKPFTNGVRTQGLHGYNAVDYGLPIGTPIYAAAAGTVIISKNSGYNAGYGNYVAIQHPNNTQTVYGHFTQTVVEVGQSVKQGQLIGYSGNTGKSTGPHLHFEIRGAKNPF